MLSDLKRIVGTLLLFLIVMVLVRLARRYLFGSRGLGPSKRDLQLQEMLKQASNSRPTLPHLPRERPGLDVRDLRVTVTAQPGSDPRLYRLEVRNSGNRDYRSLTLNDRELLLYAECFSLDTTHMPADQLYAAGEPLVIDHLAAGETAVLLRQGYGRHDRYDGPRRSEMPIAYTVDDQVITLADFHRCPVEVRLAGTR